MYVAKVVIEKKFQVEKFSYLKILQISFFGDFEKNAMTFSREIVNN